MPKQARYFQKQRNSGMTLLEVMLVVAVVAIIGTLAMPSFENYQRNQKIKSTLRQIKWLLYSARITALKANSYSVINLSSSGCLAYLDNGEGPGGIARDWEQQDDEKVIDEITLSPLFTLSNTFPTKDTFRYFNHIGISNPGSIILYYNSVAVGKVVVNITGRVRIEML